MTDTIDRARKVLEQATPGKWETALSVTHGMDFEARYGGSGAVLVHSPDDCEHHPIADASCNHSCRTTEEQEANACAIVLARNVLPAALDLAEAQQAWRDYCDGVDIVEEDTANALSSAVDDALAAFFAALDANLPPEEKP